MIWSFTLAAIGILGLWAAGRRYWWGWAVGLGAQLLWIAYALATRQYGFIVSALAYGVVYGRNAVAWRRDARARERQIRLGRRRLPPPTDTACEACGVIHPGYHKQWCPTIPADWFTEMPRG